VTGIVVEGDDDE